MLKDRLKEVIKMKVCTGLSLEFDSINELMLGWYENYRDGIKHENPTYRDIQLEIVYDEVFDNDGNSIEETDFITIKEDLEEQIASINDMFEKGMVK